MFNRMERKELKEGVGRFTPVSRFFSLRSCNWKRDWSSSRTVRSTKHSFLYTCVPKYNLGTRRDEGGCGTELGIETGAVT